MLLNRPRFRSSTLPLAAALVLLVALPAGAAAKKGRAIFEGTVMDQANEPIAGVEITVTGEDDFRATAKSNRKGEFSIDLVEGEFVLEMEREGYAPFAQAIRLEAGQRQSARINLLDAELGRRNEAIVAYNEGVAAVDRGDHAAAKARFLAAIEADPTLVEPYRGLTNVYLDMGSHAEAAATAEKLLELQPGDREVMVVAYDAYRALGNRAKVDALRAELAADPSLAPKLAVQVYNDGARALQRGDEPGAIVAFEEALALDPQLTAAHGALASLLYNRERYADAKAVIDKLLAVEPNNAKGHRTLYLIHDAQGQLEAARQAMEAYIEVDAAGGAELLMTSADRSFKGGQHEEARQALVRLLELEPDHPQAHYTLGLVYLSLDPSKARPHLNRFLELAPDGPDADHAREVLAGL